MIEILLLNRPEVMTLVRSRRTVNVVVAVVVVVAIVTVPYLLVLFTCSRLVEYLTLLWSLLTTKKNITIVS